MPNSLPPPDLHAGSTLGRYELLLPIAKGGMAQVWAARLRGSRGFQKLVAVKTILAGSVDNTRMEEMFLEEAQLASQIHHPNVVGTLDLGEHEGVLYLVMEWVEGEPLSAVIAKAAATGGVPLAIGVNLIGQACKGLSAAHDLRDDSGALLGVVHRDVSPQNVLVTYSGTAKLVDFGIAKATSKASGLTEAGEIKGKFAYMAPEQVRGVALDCRTDLFALGILLYAITTGRHPFRGEHPAQTVQNICSERAPTPPSAFISEYPAALEQVVLKALAKDPEQRFPNATAMLTALEQAMPGPLEASFDKQVAEYLGKLFGNRASERRAALRIAQETADRVRTESTSSISVGTLRAIAIDQLGNTPPSGAPSLHVTSTLTSTPTPLPAAPRSPRTALLSAASLLAIALAGVAVWRAGGASSEATRAAAASPVPVVSLEQLKPAVSAAPTSAPAASATEAASPTPADGTDLVESERAEPRGRTKRGVGIRIIPPAPVAAPKAASVPPASPAPATVTPPAPTPAAPPAAPSTNAWDRGAFGGRH
jgi:serine/threonine protein kinase